MNKKHRRLPRLLIIGAILLALLTASAFAILSAYNRSPPEHTFKPADEIDPSINETFDGINKENVTVSVSNTKYAVYVRAAIVVNWEENGKDADGKKTVTSTDTGIFHATAPKLDTDYTLNLNDTDWFKGSDGFYYHKAMVNSNGTTEALINSCQRVATAPTGYHLDVQIIAQTIQALGTTDADDTPAVTNAWGIAVDSSGNLVEPTP